MGIEPFERPGHWKLPGVGGEVRGVMARDEQGHIMLKYVALPYADAFSAYSLKLDAPMEGIPPIAGHLDDGKKVTLLDNSARVSSFASGTPTLTYCFCADSYLEGNQCFEKEEDMQFKFLRLHIPGLSDWLNIKSTITPADKDGNRTIRFGDRRGFSPYTSERGTKFSFSFLPRFTIDDSSEGRKYEIYDDSCLAVEFNERSGIDCIRHFSNAIRDFFRLVMDNRAYFENIRVFNNASPLEFYIKDLCVNSGVQQFYSPVFYHSDIKDEFSDIVISWLDLYNNFNDLFVVAKLYFYVLNHEELPNIIKFQLLIQGIEAFFQQENSAFHCKFGYERRKPLEGKIKNFIDPLQDHLGLSKPEINAAAKKIAEIRNDWLHKAKVNNDTQFPLRNMVYFILLICRLSMLRWIGVPMEKIDKHRDGLDDEKIFSFLKIRP